MTGRRFMRSLLTVLLMSVVGLGGWSMPVPARAQNAGDAAPMVTPEDLADVSVFYEPLAPYGTGTSLPACGQIWIPKQPQDARRHQGERQGGAQTTFEERQRHTLPPRLQGLSPEELRVQRGAERRVLEEKARRDRQESEQPQAQQPLQQLAGTERQRTFEQQHPQIQQLRQPPAQR